MNGGFRAFAHGPLPGSPGPHRRPPGFLLHRPQVSVPTPSSCPGPRASVASPTACRRLLLPLPFSNVLPRLTWTYDVISSCWLTWFIPHAPPFRSPGDRARPAPAGLAPVGLSSCSRLYASPPPSGHVVLQSLGKSDRRRGMDGQAGVCENADRMVRLGLVGKYVGCICFSLAVWF